MRSVTSSRIDELKQHLGEEAAAIESCPLPGEVPGSFERFVLNHGREYVSRCLHRDELAIVSTAIHEYRRTRGRFHRQQCFANSQDLLQCDESGKLVYVEGFAWTHALHHVLHGWLTINGKVVDVTLPPTTRREAKLREPRQAIGEFADRTYFGVPFRRAYLAQRIRATGGPGSLFDDPEHRYPLLRNRPEVAVRRAKDPPAEIVRVIPAEVPEAERLWRRKQIVGVLAEVLRGNGDVDAVAGPPEKIDHRRRMASREKTKKTSRSKKPTIRRPTQNSNSASARTRDPAIDEYLAKASPKTRALLQELRRTIHAIVPEVEECISYRLPAFRYDGRIVAGFQATSAGCSYYPFSGTTLATLAADIEGYSHTKSALHFDADKSLPPSLVKKLLKTRMAEGKRR